MKLFRIFPVITYNLLPSSLVFRIWRGEKKNRRPNFVSKPKIQKNTYFLGFDNDLFLSRFFFHPKFRGKKRTVKWPPSFRFFWTTDTLVCDYREIKKPSPLAGTNIDFQRQRINSRRRPVKFNLVGIRSTPRGLITPVARNSTPRHLKSNARGLKLTSRLEIWRNGILPA